MSSRANQERERMWPFKKQHEPVDFPKSLEDRQLERITRFARFADMKLNVWRPDYPHYSPLPPIPEGFSGRAWDQHGDGLWTSLRHSDNGVLELFVTSMDGMKIMHEQHVRDQSPEEQQRIRQQKKEKEVALDLHKQLLAVEAAYLHAR